MKKVTVQNWQNSQNGMYKPVMFTVHPDRNHCIRYIKWFDGTFRTDKQSPVVRDTIPSTEGEPFTVLVSDTLYKRIQRETFYEDKNRHVVVYGKESFWIPVIGNQLLVRDLKFRKPSKFKKGKLKK